MALAQWREASILTDRLSNAIKRGSFSHAYLIEANNAVDKLQFAKDISKALWCGDRIGEGCDACPTCRKIDSENHGDLYIIRNEGLSIGDDEIAHMQEELSKKSVEGRGHIAVITSGELMTERAQNRLLKTLEEPYENTVIFILTDSRTKLLQTIRSRCVLLPLGNFVFSDDVNKQSYEDAKSLLNMIFTSKPFINIANFVRDIRPSKEESLAIIDSMELLMEGKLSVTDGRVNSKTATKSILKLEEARQKILLNVDPQKVLKGLSIELEEC